MCVRARASHVSPTLASPRLPAPSQLLSGAKIIDVDLSLEGDRKLYSAASKLLGLLITLGEALAYVLSGMYGDVRDLGAVTSILLIVQLTFAGVIVLTLDDLLSKGYGLGSGINLFIVTNICETFLWKCLSPTTFNVGKGTEFEGAIIAALHGLLFKSQKGRALLDALFRENLPNLTNLLATALVFLVVIYIQGFKIEVPLRTTVNQPRGAPGRTHSIKLFYTSNMPIILLSALVANVYFFSQVLHRRYPANILVKLLGRWSEPTPNAPNSRPVGGLSYYISPPGTFADIISDPFHAVFYITFMLSACALFAKTWIEISGSGPREVLAQLKQAQAEVKNANVYKLSQMIPTAAAFGGMCVAALSILADLLGAIGSGTGVSARARWRRAGWRARARAHERACPPSLLSSPQILMAVSIIYEFCACARERARRRTRARARAAHAELVPHPLPPARLVHPQTSACRRRCRRSCAPTRRPTSRRCSPRASRSRRNRRRWEGDIAAALRVCARHPPSCVCVGGTAQRREKATTNSSKIVRRRRASPDVYTPRGRCAPTYQPLGQLIKR